MGGGDTDKETKPAPPPLITTKRSFDSLFESLGAPDAEAATALAELLAMGAQAVPKLVDRIIAGRGRSDATALLAYLAVADHVDTIAPLLHHANGVVRDAGVRALARTGDPRVLPLITTDMDRNPDLAISALGDLGAPDAAAAVRALARRQLGELDGPTEVAALQARANKSGDVSTLLTLCATATSLAKLGDFSMRGTACGLARFVNEDIPEASLVRVAAISALDVMVGPGIAAVLKECCSDPDSEVAGNAVRAEMHLGRVRAVDHWLEIFEREDGTLGAPVRSAVRDLVGRDAPEYADEARAWWAKRSKRYDPSVCYRFGIPAQPSRLVRRARGPEGTINRRELRQMLGLPFLEAILYQAPAAEIAALDACWREHAGDFPFGKLHRWGRTYEPDACD